jgi:hypothetical protein
MSSTQNVPFSGSSFPSDAPIWKPNLNTVTPSRY